MLGGWERGLLGEVDETLGPDRGSGHFFYIRLNTRSSTGQRTPGGSWCRFVETFHLTLRAPPEPRSARRSRVSPLYTPAARDDPVPVGVDQVHDPVVESVLEETRDRLKTAEVVVR